MSSPRADVGAETGPEPWDLNSPVRHESHVIGAFSTLAVFSATSPLLDAAYKVIFSVITAILASIASNLVGRYMRRNDRNPQTRHDDPTRNEPKT